MRTKHITALLVASGWMQQQVFQDSMHQLRDNALQVVVREDNEDIIIHRSDDGGSTHL
jgi:hypothetical protein